MFFALNGTCVTLTFDLVTSEFIGVIYWPWSIFLLSTMTVTHKLFKILSGHDVANGRTDGWTDGRTDERHTIIRPKFHFGRIINKDFEYLWIFKCSIYPVDVSTKCRQNLACNNLVAPAATVQLLGNHRMHQFLKSYTT